MITQRAFSPSPEPPPTPAPANWERGVSIVLLATLPLGLAARLVLAKLAVHPGHADSAFYYTLAENLADGRGLEIDYIWNYLAAPRTLPHPATDYWMPLTAVLISLSFFLLGKSLFTALLPSIVFALALTVLVYAMSLWLSRSHFTALVSASLIFLLPPVFLHSLFTISIVYYAVFTTASLFLMMRGWRDSTSLVLAGGCAGLAHLTRQDGILLLPILFGVIALSPQPRARKAVTAALALLLYAALLAPLLYYNYRSFGSPIPPGARKMMFLTTYEDIYAYWDRLTLQNYLAWGLPNILWSKFAAALGHARTLAGLCGGVMSIFVIVSFLDILTSPARRRQWHVYLPPFLFATLLYLSYSLVGTTIPLSFGQSMVAVAPFIVVGAIVAINRHVPSPVVRSVIILALAAMFFAQGLTSSWETISAYREMAVELQHVKAAIQDDRQRTPGGPTVIMTRNPWEVYHSTRYRAVQIPNEDLDTIATVAKRFGVTYLLLPAPRQAVEGVYRGTQVDQRFEFMTTIPQSPLKLFRVKLDR